MAVEGGNQPLAEGDLEGLGARELRRCVELAADGLAILSGEGAAVRLEGLATRLFRPARGSGALELLGSVKIETPEGKPLAPEQAPWSRARRQQEVVRGEVVLLQIAPEGWRGPQRLFVSVSAAPTGAGGAVVTLTDVTRLYALQEQQEDLLRAISHDLRTPLSTLVLQAQLIARRPGPFEEVARRADAILVSATRINNMIRDLVDSIRLEGRGLHLHRRPLELSSWWAELRERLAGVLAVDRIMVQIPAGLPIFAADPDQLERVLVNLLGNALKYSPMGSPVVLEAFPGSDSVILSITNQGEGIAQQDLPRVFMRFFRGRIAQRTEGLGLGLHIASMLVRAHGGEISVHSEPELGTTFTVELPVGRPVVERIAQGTGPLVLLVEDDAGLRSTLHAALEDEGFEVVGASNGIEALAVLGRCTPALMVLDLAMPVLDGWGLLEKLREDQRLARIPVVVCSERRLHSAGIEPSSVAGYLEKPLDFEALLALARRVLGVAEQQA